MKTVRVPIFHEGTFTGILQAALRARTCLRYRGGYWYPIASGRGYHLYRRAPSPLPWIQERVDDYEWFVYSRMLQGHIGEDGMVRPRSRLVRTATGAYRSRSSTGGRIA